MNAGINVSCSFSNGSSDLSFLSVNMRLSLSAISFEVLYSLRSSFAHDFQLFQTRLLQEFTEVIPKSTRKVALAYSSILVSAYELLFPHALIKLDQVLRNPSELNFNFVQAWGIINNRMRNFVSNSGNTQKWKYLQGYFLISSQKNLFSVLIRFDCDWLRSIWVPSGEAKFEQTTFLLDRSVAWIKFSLAPFF